VSLHTARRNASVRKYGCGDPAAMTREQLTARVGFLRDRGRHFEAAELLQAWLRASKART
jgi:hypothetical protein